jgi:hypothetical protein
MTLTEVEIPLSHLGQNQRGRRGYYISMYRAHVSEELEEVLLRISGPGCDGLWWTEDELRRYMSNNPKEQWAWTPSGDMDHEVSDYQSNHQTHMRIFFRDPNHALLFKLTWQG